MQITPVTEENFASFAPLLPPYKKQRPTHILGCVLNDTAVAAAAMHATEDGCSLAWLYVAPAYRAQGVGGALLDALCRAAAACPSHELTVTYGADAPWANVLEYMFLTRGFMVFTHTYPQYQLTKDELSRSPLLTASTDRQNGHIVPLAQLPNFRLRELLAKSRLHRSYSISHADFDRADGARSMALIKDDEIQGLTLLTADSADDILSLDLFYLASSASAQALPLLRRTANAVLTHPSGLRVLRFTCMEDAAQRICERILGDVRPAPVRLCHGSLQTDLFRERRSSDVR